MARESLTRALTQLVDLGWLENPETMGKKDRYALTERCKGQRFVYPKGRTLQIA